MHQIADSALVRGLAGAGQDGRAWNDLCMPARGTRPESFHYQNCDYWGTWVLGHGLPALPDLLGEDDEVPVASWAGPIYGAVLFRSWWSASEEHSTDVEPAVADNEYCYVRTESGWQPLGTGSGSAGASGDPMRGRTYPERFAYFDSEWQGGPVRGLTGAVGAAARTIEVLTTSGPTRRSIDGPLGLVIVCFDALEQATIQVLDADDQPLLETNVTPDP